MANCFDIGQKAPNFTATAILNGNPLNPPEQISLEQYRGRWVVLFFYGSDFTFV